jgi:dipeptidyl aminopeptidase/acylaminoacyl peptidase
MFTSFHGGIIFSPDGNAAYWQALLNDESKGQAIFEARVEKGFWTNPRVAPFSEPVRGGRDDSPFISPDGERLFFLSTRPIEKGGESGAEKIWIAKRAGEGWLEPELIPLRWNPANGRIHWRLSVDGKDNLYFGAWKIHGEEITGEIFHSRFEDGQYGPPEKLGPEINREGYYNFCPSVAPDGSYLIFTRVGPKAKDRLPDNIYCSFRDRDGKWTHAQKLQIPGDKGNDVPAISSDGKYLFMRHGLNQFYWVETSIVEKLRPKE